MFKCRERCGQCCGPVPILMATYNANKEKAGEHVVIGAGGVQDKTVFVLRKNGINCAFLDPVSKKCRIYMERPQVCREFGESDTDCLRCPYLRKDGSPRPDAERAVVVKKMDEMIEGVKPLKIRDGHGPAETDAGRI